MGARIRGFTPGKQPVLERILVPFVGVKRFLNSRLARDLSIQGLHLRWEGSGQGNTCRENGGNEDGYADERAQFEHDGLNDNLTDQTYQEGSRLQLAQGLNETR